MKLGGSRAGYDHMVLVLLSSAGLWGSFRGMTPPAPRSIVVVDSGALSPGPGPGLGLFMFGDE